MTSSASDVNIPEVHLPQEFLAAYGNFAQQDLVPAVADFKSLHVESFLQYQGSPFKGAVDKLIWQDCVFERLDECLNIFQT